MGTEELLNKFEKEQSELKIKEDKELEFEKRTSNFLQTKFNEKHAGKCMLMGIPIVIICGWFIFGTNIFDDGLMRFLLSLLFTMTSASIMKRYYYYKLKEEFALK